jgi:hypothetical protein
MVGEVSKALELYEETRGSGLQKRRKPAEPRGIRQRKKPWRRTIEG